MVTFELPELFKVTACVWLAPTEMLPKLRVEGLSVICPLAPNAFEVRERIKEKKTNKRNLHEISLQQGELFTAQPHVPRESYAEGDKKPQPLFCRCSTRGCGTSSVQPMAEHQQVTEGHSPRQIGHCGTCTSDTVLLIFGAFGVIGEKAATISFVLRTKRPP